MCGIAGTSASSRSSVNTSNRSGRGLAIGLPLFIVVCFFGELRQFPGAGSSHRSVAGLEDVLDGPAVAM